MRALVFMAVVQTYYATQKALSTNKFIVTTENSRRNKKVISPEVNHIDSLPTLTHYDWSLDVEHETEKSKYYYNNLWLVTLRDYFTIDTSPSPTTRTLRHLKKYKNNKKDPVHSTKRVTKSSTDFNKSVANKNEKEYSDHKVNNNRGKIKHFGMPRISVNRPNVANNNFHAKIGKDFKRGSPKNYLTGVRARANAVKNKQIHRKFDEIAHRDNVKTITSAKPALQGVKLDAIPGKSPLNFGEKKVKELSKSGGLYNSTGMKMEKLKLDRQTIQPERIPSVRGRSTRVPVPEDNPYWLGIITVRPVNLVQQLKSQMGVSRAGYFSGFVSQCARIIAEKPESEIRLLALSLERDFYLLSHQTKYILSFGQPFLKVLEAFATHLPLYPYDFVKSQAMIIHFTTLYRREQINDELNSIIDYIDELFEEDEGLALFKAVEFLNNFPITEENSYEVLKAIFAAVFAPYGRLSGAQRQFLIESINNYLAKFDSPLPFTKQNRRRFNNVTIVVGSRNNKKKVKVKHINNIETRKTTKLNKISHTSKVKDIRYVNRHLERINGLPKKQAGNHSIALI